LKLLGKGKKPGVLLALFAVLALELLVFSYPAIAQTIESWFSFNIKMAIAEKEVVESYQAYYDEEMTSPLIAINYGTSIEQGETFDCNVYVKNTGNVDGVVSLRVVDDVSSYMSYTITPEYAEIGVGDSAVFVLTFSVYPDVTPGTYIDMEVEGYTP